MKRTIVLFVLIIICSPALAYKGPRDYHNYNYTSSNPQPRYDHQYYRNKFECESYVRSARSYQRENPVGCYVNESCCVTEQRNTEMPIWFKRHLRYQK